MDKFASIDLGTHSTRLLIATIQDRAVNEIERQTIITRLGEGIEDSYIKPEAITRTTNALALFMDSMNKHGVKKVVAFATSAVRDAINKQEFIESAKSVIGVEPDVLDGRKEATLSFRGVCAALKDNAGLENMFVVDIGGGSTEIAYGKCDTDELYTESLDIGCLRIKEMFIRSDPPSNDEIVLLEKYIKEMVGRIVLKLSPSVRAFVVAGTATSLMAIKLQLQAPDYPKVHMQKLSILEIREMAKFMSSMTLKELEQLKGLERGRAPVIFPGVMILKTVMEAFGLRDVTVSECDNLDGALATLNVDPQPSWG